MRARGIPVPGGLCWLRSQRDQPWLINSQTGSLTRSCISQLCTPPAASVELCCPGNPYNLPSIKSFLLLWNIKILWKAEILFLQTCTALNFSMHYTLFPFLRSNNIVFGGGFFQNSVMVANRGCPWSWTKLHRHCRGVWLGTHSGQDNSVFSPSGQLKAGCPKSTKVLFKRAGKEADGPEWGYHTSRKWRLLKMKTVELTLRK